MKKNIALLACAIAAVGLGIHAAAAQANLFLERQLALVGQKPAATAPLRNSSMGTTQTVRVPQQETFGTFVDGAWMDEVSTTYTYNPHGQKELSSSVFLMPPVIETRNIYSYNDNGHTTEVLTQTKAGDEWEDYQKNTFEYEGENLKKFEYYVKTAGFGWQLVAATRYTHTMQGGLLAESVSETFSAIATDMHDWRNSKKLVYSYTGNSTKPDAITTYDWLAQNGASSQWYETEHEANIIYEGTSDNIASYYTRQTSWTNGNNLISSFKYEYQYSENPTEGTRTIVETKFAVHPVSGALTPHTRVSSTALITAAHYVFVPLSWLRETYTNNGWVRENEIKLLITQNTRGDITQVVQQNYSPEADDFVNIDRFVYDNFTDVTRTSAADDLFASAVSVYPNPTQSNLHIALDASKVQEASLSIYNLTGQKVYELASLRGEVAIDMSHLPKAVYMVRIAGANSAGITKKIVKQ